MQKLIKKSKNIDTNTVIGGSKLVAYTQDYDYRRIQGGGVNKKLH